MQYKATSPVCLDSIQPIQDKYLKIKTEHTDYPINSRIKHYGNFNIGQFALLCFTHTCNIVKFSSTLFIMYFSGKCFSLCIKLIIYSHMGDLCKRYTNLPFSNRAYSVYKMKKELIINVSC